MPIDLRGERPMIDTLAAWHDIVSRRNTAGIEPLLSEDVVLFSPVVHTPQVGKRRTLPYLQAAYYVFLNDSFRYVRELRDSGGAVLEFTLEIDGIAINGVDMIKWNDEGLITEFKVMLRPLKAVNLIHQKMGEMLAAASKTE